MGISSKTGFFYIQDIDILNFPNLLELSKTVEN